MTGSAVSCEAALFLRAGVSRGRNLWAQKAFKV